VSGVRRIDQDMASAAAELLPAEVTQELRTRYRQLRIMLRTAGLAATYAFIAAKAGEGTSLAEAYRKAGQGIGDRLADAGLIQASAQRDARAFLAALGGMSAVEYARASAEAAALAGWLSRLADAVYQRQQERPQ
jgi:CRISPR/Cas system CMR-associated protein Cmr5 small subunit